MLDALGGSKQRDDILVHTRYLNGFVLYPYTPVGQAVRMDRSNYDPNQGTPLYDQTVVPLACGFLLAAVVSLARVLAAHRSSAGDV